MEEDFASRHHFEVLKISRYGWKLTLETIPWLHLWRWMTVMGIEIMPFAVMLTPAFFFYVVSYFTDSRIRRRLCLDSNTPDQHLDIYLPVEAALAQKKQGPKVPVVVGIMGGAFLVTHRAYNVQWGLSCADAGIIFVSLDYPNFPSAEFPDMAQQVTRAFQWIFQNIESLGGDLGNVVLVGYSAGACLGSFILLERCLLEAQTIQAKRQPGDDQRMPLFSDWSVKMFKAFFGVSGFYDLPNQGDFLGMPRKLTERLARGDPELCSPVHLLSRDAWKQVSGIASSLMPPIFLFHGAHDRIVPVLSCTTFADQARFAGLKVQLDVRSTANHTYAVIEGPIMGQNILLESMLPVLVGEEETKERLKRISTKCLLPRSLVKFASACSPFGRILSC